MKETSIGRRLLCILLAAELLCVPLLGAAASEGPGETAGEAEPLTTELTAQYFYDLGYGVPFELADGKTAILEYQDRFAVEGAVKEGGSYGRTAYTSQKNLPNDGDKRDPKTFCVFPAVADLGRVPDRTFEGWYVLPAEAYNGATVKSWTYEEGMERVEALPYDDAAPFYDKYGDLGDTWDGSRLYDGYNSLDMERPVGLVGRWVPSAEARLSALDLTAIRANQDRNALRAFYREDIAGLRLTGESPTPEAFSPDVSEYWLRVDPDVTSLDLSFDTMEPFFDFHVNGADCPVEVAVTFGGAETYRAAFDSQMLPLPEGDAETGFTPLNSAEDPAHARWELAGETGIPLEASAGEAALYNDITITVTAPDGEMTCEYLLHVQRLSDPALTQSPGNTPAGMIARDTSAVWGAEPAAIAANKKAALAYFASNHAFESKYYPQDGDSLYGSIFKGSYNPKAWAPHGQNLDLEPTAIVVYQDAAFLDPGISLTDAEGNPVTLSEGGYAGTVERTLKLRTADALTIDGVKVDEGADCWYADGALSTTETSETIRTTDGSDRVDLRGLKVLPGIYSMEYRYTDPVTGEVYTSESAGFSYDKENASGFHRAVIVLPAPGDVDMDGAVTMADAVTLEGSMELSGGGSAAATLAGADLNADPAAALFAYRVCDLTHDGTLNADDVDKLEGGFVPELNKRGDSDYYYPPLATGGEGERYTRKTLAEATASAQPGKSAQISMEYLGKETGSFHKATGATTNPCGPWRADTTEGVVLEDTFWMGVRLTQADQIQWDAGGITTFTFTLTYDGRYVSPAAVVTQAQIDEAALDTFDKKWQGTLRVYDLGSASQTIWGSEYDYRLTNFAAPSLPYTAHYSKAITPLEGKVSRESDLKELAFSIQVSEGKTPAPLKDGWLFAVPFTLIRHPYGQTAAQLVELGAGMRDFVFVSGGAAALSEDPAYSRSSAAYSAQDDIFGGATANLRTAVGYAAAGTPIPLGEDQSEPIVLKNAASSDGVARYSQAFQTAPDDVPTLVEGEITGLPPGITYNKYNGLTGIPEQAGLYDFYISDNHYVIDVKKAPLRLYVDSAASYYGQPEYRGSPSGDFVFHYYEQDIQSLDRARAEQAPEDEIVIDGQGAHLAALLADKGYSPPTFQAQVGESYAKANTPIGKYAIQYRLLPQSTNYAFEYVTQKPDKTNAGEFAILQRPFVVSNLAEGTNVGEVYSDTPGSIEGITAVLGGQKAEYIARLPDMLTPGWYDGYPLTGEPVLAGDMLTISYNADYIQQGQDGQSGDGFFYLESFRESRSVNVSELKLMGEGSASNYELKSKALADPVEGWVKGDVIRRNITDISIEDLPPMKYQYGDHLDSSNALHILIHKADIDRGTYSYSEEMCKREGITVTWATEQEKAAGQPGSLPYRQSQALTVAEHDGRYICVSAQYLKENGEMGVRTTYSAVPVQVTPRPLTLTALPLERYYGEPNGDLTYAFTYHVNELTNDHRAAHSGLKGEGKELDLILADAREGYRRPDLAAVRSSSDRTAVDEYTTVGSNYAILISGAKAANYAIRYAVADQTGYDDAQGSSTLKIRPRPIVVDRIEEGRANALLTLYADTRQIYTVGLSLTLDEVALSLPGNTPATTTYYPKGGTMDNNPITVSPGYRADAPVLLDGDKDKLALTYTATAVPDNLYYTSFTNGYFKMDKADQDGAQVYDVQITDLALTGAAAGNYALVYKNSGSAKYGMPTETQLLENRPDAAGGTKNYYAAGKGTVRLRPIESIEIVSAPKLSYTYGDAFRPDLKDAATRQPLKVILHYAREGDNYAGNTTSETVEFRVDHKDKDGNPITTFDERSLVIYGVREGETARQLLTYSEYVTVADTGLHLVVEGRRGESDALRTSAPTAAALKVEPRSLTLNVATMERFYGEPNKNAAFTFDESELAKPDREILTAQGFSGADGGTALSRLAQERGFTYEPPALETEATQSSPVLNGGLGSYPICVTGGSLSNYTLKSGDGALYIYRRPVYVDHFESSKDKPIYTIYADTEKRVFDTNVDKDSFAMRLPDADRYPNEVNYHELSLSGSAIYGSDPISLNLKVRYKIPATGVELGALSGIPQDTYVDRAEIKPGSDAAQNYQLLANTSPESDINQAWKAVGAVNLREIESIRVLTPPTRLTYEYHQPLDLTGLMVEITYAWKQGDDDKQKTSEISYVGKEQFEQFGLYVNYYESDTPPSNDFGRVLDHREAQTGDHLTIAPTHDSRTGQSFAANGKYLIVSARLHTDHDWVQPQIVSQTPITVTPLRLSFSLSAEDKTFDGDAETAGTLTLHNVYQRDGYVDAYHQNGVTDMVYPVTQAAYESTWGDFAGYGDFKSYLLSHENRYQFSTGVYVPNGPAPLGDNGYVNYAEGYRHGTGLTFTLLDSDVAYEPPPAVHQYGTLAAIPVQCTGITLAGPDAANYEIVAEVTPETVAEAAKQGYAASDLPEATIHKANRKALTTELLPQVEVDVHTNVVRLSYGQTLDVAQPESKPEYQAETHFEYALQYAAEEADAPICWWAGEAGTQGYQDARFFGGEAVAPQVPEGYVPLPDDIPEELEEDDILKGQRYRWAGEDEGFLVYDAAYPGGASYPGYELYGTRRGALPRDTVLWGLVRVSETHNFNASPILSSVEGLTPELIQASADAQQAVAEARSALEEIPDGGDTAAAAAAMAATQAVAGTAADAVRRAVSAAADGAKTQAREQAEYLIELGETGKWPEKEQPPVTWTADPPPAPAVKTYAQRLDAVSVQDRQGQQTAEGQSTDGYNVPILEAVWFTDVLEYEKKQTMDAVLRNNDPTRYYGYYWDALRSAELKFEDKEQPISLAGPIEHVEVKKTDENGAEYTDYITVNEDHTARLYVNISGGGGSILENSIRIEPHGLTAVVGSEPVQLSVVFDPKYATVKTVSWKTSDSKVATVSRKGVVCFVGVGTAVITATSINGRQDSIEVTVLSSWYDKYPASIFDLSYPNAYVTLEDTFFGPDVQMTRGELVCLLAQFYKPNVNWKGSGSGEFPDIIGVEPFAEAARLLGRLGVITGTETGRFEGERLVTRAELVVILTRMLGVEVPDTKGMPHAYLDTGETDTWAYAYIDAADGLGIVRGVGEGNFAPARPVTRAEVVVILDRLLATGLDPTAQRLLHPADVGEDHWAYASIIRAVNGSGAGPDPDREEKE